MWRSTPTRACIWAAVRRNRKLEVVAMLSLPQTPAVHCLALTCQWRHPYARTSGPRSWGPAERLLPGSTPSNLTVATTGASGSLFLKHFLLLLENDSRVKTVNFIASDSGLRVMAEELDIRGRANLVARVLGKPSRKIEQQANADIGANVASGSYPS